MTNEYQTKREKIVLNYFFKTLKTMKICLMVVTLLLIVAAILSYEFDLPRIIKYLIMTLFFVSFISTVFVAYSDMDNYMSDVEYYHLMQSDYYNCFCKALNMFGLNNSIRDFIKPIIIKYPEYIEKKSRILFKLKKKLGVCNYNKSRYVILFSLNNQIYYFNTWINHQTGKLYRMETMVLNKKSVSYFSTSIDLKKVYGRLRDVLIVKMHLNNSEAIDIYVRNKPVKNRYNKTKLISNIKSPFWILGIIIFTIALMGSIAIGLYHFTSLSIYLSVLSSLGSFIFPALFFIINKRRLDTSANDEILENEKDVINQIYLLKNKD